MLQSERGKFDFGHLPEKIELFATSSSAPVISPSDDSEGEYLDDRSPLFHKPLISPTPLKPPPPLPPPGNLPACFYKWATGE